MPSVYHCSPTNSTKFTTCCHVAICDNRERCPKCGADVYPFSKGMSEKDRQEAARNVGYSRYFAARQR